MLVKPYEEFLRIRRESTIGGAVQAYLRFVAPFGFMDFACGELDLADRNRSVYYAIHWEPRWRKFYLGSHFIQGDPIIDALAYRHEPFIWSDLRRDRKFGKAGRVALDLLARLGWKNGLVIPLPGNHRRVGLVSLVGTMADYEPDMVAQVTFVSLGLYYHLKTLVTQQGFAQPPAGLSPRELQCVRLVAQGRSDADVAAKLGIAPSTAHEFIEKAKRRLNARTRASMIAIATALGIIDI